jgi:hypothetical protein
VWDPGPFYAAARVQGIQFGEGSGWIAASDGPEDIPTPVIPLPLAAWGGLVLMGGMGVTRTIRRRRA